VRVVITVPDGPPLYCQPTAHKISTFRVLTVKHWVTYVLTFISDSSICLIKIQTWYCQH